MTKNLHKYHSDHELNKNVIDYTIHDKLSSNDIEEIRKIFFSKTDKSLNFYDFRETLKLFNIIMINEQYSRLFLKINLNGDNLVSWDEFATYLIYGFNQDDVHTQQDSLLLPISMEPTVKNASHKTQIIGISLMQNLDNDDEDQFGTYLTVSKDGFINFWTPEYDITKNGLSKSPYYKYTPTLVLGVVALSDVRVICISSTERELRFYDVMATNFHLRLIIRSVPCAIHTMSYFHTTTNVNVNSRLLMGDMNGNVYSIEFSPILRGPFKSKAGFILMEYTWTELLKKKLPSIIPRVYPNIFNEFITDILYSLKFDTIYVSAEGHGYTGGLAALDEKGTRTNFLMPQGVTAFALDEHNRILATGGPDEYIRLWDPSLPSKASAILSGHHAGIIYIFIQTEETKCYSIDKAKIIKVWHLFDLTLLQTYSELLFLIPNETSLTYYYNKTGRELIVGGRKFVAIKCCLKHKLDLTDGYTHTAAISVVLYNHLFENIVTCGLDSHIIVWDLWTGKRQLVMKGCHTEDVMGQTTSVEITAATFDPERQYLLTGARNGSLKVWNYNNAYCMRNMTIGKGCEVTSVMWVDDRIFAVGWNHRVTQFDGQYGDAKNWYTVHDDDISAAACKVGETLVTGSAAGELVLWKIDTGQPYRKYDVEHPTQYIPINIDVNVKNATLSTTVRKRQKLSRDRFKRHSVSRFLSEQKRISHSKDSDKPKERKKKITRMDSQGNIMPLPLSEEDSCEIHRHMIAIQAVLFLKSRAQTKDNGTVVVSLDSGFIQVYSHHKLGAFINEFYSIHKSGDYCLSLATDKANKYLFTGTAFGYLKIWLIQNYGIPESEHTHVCKPLLRLQFFFLMTDRVLGRAKRVARHEEPLLLNSYKAHLSAITSIIFIEHSKVVLTGSNDYSVRMWTLGGRYLGTLGSHIPLIQLSRDISIDEDDQRFRIPPDINKVASSTTVKVLTAKPVDKITEYLRKSAEEARYINLKEKGVDDDDTKIISIYQKSTRKECRTYFLKEPLLGKHCKLNECSRVKNNPILDTNLPHIPVYTHLKICDTKLIKRPRTPERVKIIKNLNFEDYYKNKKHK